MSEHIKARLVAQTAFTQGSFPIYYLCAPLTAKKWSKTECSSLVLKLISRMNVWFARNPSYAGCRVLVQIVLQSISSNWSWIIMRPQSVIKEVDACCRNFLWGMKGSGKAMPLVKLEQVCLPKQQGGLGLRMCGIWNKALLGKQL